MAKYDITKEAREDLFRIWEYTVDTWSEDQADNYFTTLISALERIASAPEKTGKPYDEIIPRLRAFHVRRHMVFFTIQENRRALSLRLLHARMDYIHHFHL